MNAATLRTPRASKRLSDPSVLASIQIDAARQIPLSDDLRSRWERIVAKGRA